jgi:hypothetical protein
VESETKKMHMNVCIVDEIDRQSGKIVFPSFAHVEEISLDIALYPLTISHDWDCLMESSFKQTDPFEHFFLFFFAFSFQEEQRAHFFSQEGHSLASKSRTRSV